MRRPRRSRPWTIEKVRSLDDEALLRFIQLLGVKVEADGFLAAARSCASPEELAQSLVAEVHPHPRAGNLRRLVAAVSLLWARWLPERPTLEVLDEWIGAGYEALEGNDERESARCWLRAWDATVLLSRERGYQTTSELDGEYADELFVCDWLSDFEDLLSDVGREDPAHWEAGIRITGEALRAFPGEEALFIEDRRYAMARFQASLGRMALVDELYRGWLASDPSWGRGWLGWAEAFQKPWQTESHDLVRAEGILREGLAADGVRDRPELLDRLSFICEATGRESEAESLARESEALRPSVEPGENPWDDAEAEMEDWEAEADEPVGDGERARTVLANGAVVERKVGRNEPCPCGSGSKFKKCCGR